MNIGLAIRICKNIDSRNYTGEEKMEAIARVLRMPTHNSITVRDLKACIKWMYGCFEQSEDRQLPTVCADGERIPKAVLLDGLEELWNGLNGNERLNK